MVHICLAGKKQEVRFGKIWEMSPNLPTPPKNHETVLSENDIKNTLCLETKKNLNSSVNSCQMSSDTLSNTDTEIRISFP